MMRTTKSKTLQLTVLGFMTALIFLFAFTPIGSIPIGPLVITLNVIPVAISAAALGPLGGAVAGGIFGLLSFLQCFGIGVPSAMGAVLVQIDPFLAFVQRFVPRLLDGFLAGLIFQAVRKHSNAYAACAVTGFCTAFLNTAFFMGTLVLLFGQTEYLQGLIGGRNILLFICTFVGVNAVVEMAACTLVTGAIGSALYQARVLPEQSKG